MGLLSKVVKIAKDNKLEDSYQFDVAGYFAHEADAISLCEPNPTYQNPKGKSRRCYKYRYFEEFCQLVPEPDNEVDKHAIAVMCRGVKVGYVPTAMQDTVRKCLKKNYTTVLSLRPGIYKEYEDDEWITYKKTSYAFVKIAKQAI